MQPWHTPFPIWNQSVVPCPVLTVASDLHTAFSKVRSGGPVFPSLSEYSKIYCDPHSQRLWLVKKAEVDVFLEFSCFFHDPAQYRDCEKEANVAKLLEKMGFPGGVKW